MGVQSMLVRAGLMALTVTLLALPLNANAFEAWRCRYQPLKVSDPPDQSDFSVQGEDLVERYGDAITQYRIIADDASSLVAVRGGAYASAPSVMAFTILIDKRSGKFVLSTASVGEVNRTQTGTCRSLSE